MVTRRTLALSETEREELEHHRDHDARAYVRERCAALLKIADGTASHAVARQGLLKPRDPDSVYAWLNRYETDKLAGLVIRAGRGRKPAFAPQCADKAAAHPRLQEIIGRAPTHFGVQRSRWTLATRLPHVHGWLHLETESGLWQLMRRVGLHYKRARDYLHSPAPHDTAKQTTIQRYWAQVHAAPIRYVFLYLDEFTFYRQPTLAAAYADKGTATPLAYRSYHSDTHARVVAALNAYTGQVTYLLRAHINLQTLRQFYALLRATYPDAGRLFVAQDNWPVHAHPDVLAVLEAQEVEFWPTLPDHWPITPRPSWPTDDLPIQLLFQPTYAPWTNPIEKLWRKLQQEQLHLHRLSDDWPALKQRVTDFLDGFAGPSPALLHYVGLLPN